MSTDVESLQSLESRIARSRRLDMCLIGSVVVLFALVLSGFAVAVLFAQSLKAGRESIHKLPQSLKSIQEDMGYKVQSFAYLRAQLETGKITKGVMDWEPITIGTGKTLGSGYEYSESQRVLTVKQEGTYFLYVQFNVSCNYHCVNESLTITFEDKAEELSCHIELPGNETVVKKCWTVIPHLEKNSKLLAKIHSDKELQGRELQVNSSGFGIFRVDGPGTD